MRDETDGEDLCCFLDHLVCEEKAEEAAAVNSCGLEEQLKYLLDLGDGCVDAGTLVEADILRTRFSHVPGILKAIDEVLAAATAAEGTT